MTASEPKGAERVARQIIEDVAEMNWPVGTLLGTEPELIDRYGVSRNSLREAIRLLEYLQVARTREGRGGGLVVTRPTPDPVSNAAAIYLRSDDVGIDELYSARISLELDIVERAIAGLDATGAERLRAALDEVVHHAADDAIPHASGVHLVLADLAGNRPMAFFVSTLISLSDEFSRPKLETAGGAMRSRVADSHHAHKAIVAAVLAEDTATATRRMRSHLTAVGKWMPKKS